MSSHDEALLDAVAVLALGALPEAEARDVRAHVATCASCAREYADLRAAADAVGLAAEATSTELDDVASRRLRARILHDVRVDSSAAIGATQRRPRRAWLPYGLAAAASLVAAVSLANVVTLRNERNDADTRARAAQAHVAEIDARVARLVAPGSRHFPVKDGEVVASGGRIVLALHDLPPLPAGKVYQAWTLAKGAKAVAPSVTFSPDADRLVLVELPVDAAQLAAVAVSVEPAGGSRVPTTKPSFIRPLT